MFRYTYIACLVSLWAQDPGLSARENTRVVTTEISGTASILNLLLLAFLQKLFFLYKVIRRMSRVCSQCVLKSRLLDAEFVLYVLRHSLVAAGTWDICCIHYTEQRLMAIRCKALFVTRVACSRSTDGMETQFGYPRCPAAFLHDDFVQIKTLPAINSSHVLEGLTQVEFCASRSGIYI
jgi:hypothetical protein